VILVASARRIRPPLAPVRAETASAEHSPAERVRQRNTDIFPAVLFVTLAVVIVLGYAMHDPPAY
jgi:hypothetical protein